MCTDCGCAFSKTHHHIELSHALLHENQQQADSNRRFFSNNAITVFNVMSSPGSGKTELLKQLIPQLQPARCGVIVGDLQTDNDAKRLRQCNVPVIQITTGNACHLDADMINNACQQLPVEQLDIIFIENVGNLVCPADYDLGQDANLVLISVTEGDDKPKKYPGMFRSADLVIQSKMDLLPYLNNFSTVNLNENLASIGAPEAMQVSAYRNLEEILTWIRQRIKKEPLTAS